MNMDLVIDTLAVIGAAACVVVAMRLVGAFLAWVERSEIARQAAEAERVARAPAPAAPVAAPRGGIPAAHVAAISAAVAMMGGTRVVRIEDNATGQAWAFEGRWQHQTSHRPH